MIRRVETDQLQSHAGFWLADPFRRGELIFEVLACGPGRWLKHPKKNKSIFITPEVCRGDYVLSRHWFDVTVHPSWHKPEYLDNVDGSGRIVLDARYCIASWRPQEVIPFESRSHLL